MLSLMLYDTFHFKKTDILMDSGDVSFKAQRIG